MIDIFADLAGVGFPVYQQGTAPKSIDESFVTVWNDDSDDILHADNKARQCRYDWTVMFYTKNTEIIYSGLITVINALKKRGYLISGQGYDTSGAWEGYDVRAVDVSKIENLEG